MTTEEKMLEQILIEIRSLRDVIEESNISSSHHRLHRRGRTWTSRPNPETMRDVFKEFLEDIKQTIDKIVTPSPPTFYEYRPVIPARLMKVEVKILWMDDYAKHPSYDIRQSRLRLQQDITELLSIGFGLVTSTELMMVYTRHLPEIIPEEEEEIKNENTTDASPATNS